jgi:phenylalanyl-tRNA synthetase beta chain
MKASVHWLKEFVDFSMSIEELSERLTMAGLEVGTIEVVGGSWDNILIGEITDISQHPNADRLKLVTVDLEKERYAVVCGAPNVAVGIKVAFARVGAQLIDGHSGETVQLKPAKIRGVVSEGMVCSEKELGISDSHEGIMVLPEDATIGTPLAEYLGDTILDLDVTPNRPDCLSMIGIAREVAAIAESKVHVPEISYEESENTVDTYASVQILEPDLCPRYCASLLTGIKITESPQWMQRRLLACGMRPINNIVDITNYVMLEYGQPLHAFDYDQIRGKQIIVRKAGHGESITTLDGVQRQLSPNMLLIADKDRAIAVAGIMGGTGSEVTGKTTTVLIESANFNQAVIHRGSLEMHLSSEASLRFEKGLSRELPLIALKRATQLMSEYAQGKPAIGILDVYPGKQHRQNIFLPIADVKRLLGIELKLSDVCKALELLEFQCVKKQSKQQVQVEVPWWRTDVKCMADLVEEIARVVGYDKIPTTMLSSSLPKHEPAPMISLRQQLSNILIGCGFQEVITYSLTSLEALERLSPELRITGPNPMKVANPMSKEQEYLRTSLRQGILSVLARNERLQENVIMLFEIGKIFKPRDNDLPREREMLCAILSGSQRRLSWRGEEEPVDFFVAKGVVETILSRLGVTANFKESVDDSLLAGRTADVLQGDTKLGVIGEIHPKVSKTFGISGIAYLIEIDVDKLSSILVTAKTYKSIPRYPSTSRDLALLVDEKVAYQQIYSIIHSCSPLVSSVNLFDFYQGEQVPKGKKSLAFRIIYQSTTHTLTDSEVDKVQQQILDRLQREIGASLRS